MQESKFDWCNWIVYGAIAALVAAGIVLSFEYPAHSQIIAELRAPEAPKNLCVSQIPDYNELDKVTSAGYDLKAKIYWRMYDMDNNGLPDYFVEYEILKINHSNSKEYVADIETRPFPTRFFVDTDGDGFYDKFYHDVMGNGRCQDIKEFQPATGNPKG